MKNTLPFPGRSPLLRAGRFVLACLGPIVSTLAGSANDWVALEVADARIDQSRRVWEFQLERAGKYVVQAIVNRQLPSPAPSAVVEVNGERWGEPLKASFVIADGTVAEFSRPVTFGRVGGHTLSIETAAALVRVRLVPHFSNPAGSGKFVAQWEVMRQSPPKQAAMAWFKEARFGMFIHWGIYAVAAGSWKGTRIENSPFPGPAVAEWLMFKFRIPRAEYAELAKQFNPDKSFARNLARLAKDAGMKYLVITAKHHDGFALFDSACSDFDLVDATPYQADAIKELYDACLAEGIEFGVYYSHGNDWRDGADGNYANVKARHDALGISTHAQGKNLWDPSPNTHAEYLEKKAYPQIAELVRRMPRLRLIWFDGEGLITEEQSFRFYKLVYDLNPGVIVNRRVGYDFGDYLDAGDNVVPAATAELTKPWETCGTTNNSWGYKAHDDNWKSTRELLYWLVDIASKGGNYLLNIGPDGRGHVPELSAAHLREMGQWLRVNGEAIYGTTRWRVVHEGQPATQLSGTGRRAAKGFVRKFTPEDFWFTARGDKVYAISLVAPGEAGHIRSLSRAAGVVKGARLLGSDRKVRWTQTATALDLDLRGVAPNEFGYVVEATFQ